MTGSACFLARWCAARIGLGSFANGSVWQAGVDRGADLAGPVAKNAVASAIGGLLIYCALFFDCISGAEGV